MTWTPQLPQGGNRIPESYRKRFALGGGGPSSALERFLKEEI